MNESFMIQNYLPMNKEGASKKFHFAIKWKIRWEFERTPIFFRKVIRFFGKRAWA